MNEFVKVAVQFIAQNIVWIVGGSGLLFVGSCLIALALKKRKEGQPA